MQDLRITNRWAVSLADAVVDAAHGRGGPDSVVDTEEDWKVVVAILEICARYFPKEVDDYLKLNKVIRSHQATEYGLMEDATTKKGGEGNVRQLGWWPFEFEVLVRIIYPRQKFDKKFNREFFRRFPALRTAIKL